MAKSTHAIVLDAMGAYIAASTSRIIACSTEPTTYVAASTTYALAWHSTTATHFSQTAYASTGRQCTVASYAGVTVTNAGTFGHVAFVNDTTKKLLYVTTGTAAALPGGSVVNFPKFNVAQVAQPT